MILPDDAAGDPEDGLRPAIAQTTTPTITTTPTTTQMVLFFISEVSYWINTF